MNINLATADRMAALPGNYGHHELGRMIRELTPVASAAEQAVRIATEALTDVAMSFGCREAEALATLIGYAGSEEAAEQFLWAHAQDDTEDSFDNPRHIELASQPYPHS